MILFNTFDVLNNFQNMNESAIKEEVVQISKALDEQDFYNHPCNETKIKPGLSDYCKNLQTITADQFEQMSLLMKQITPSAKFSPGNTWTVPFCNQGKEVSKFRKNIRKHNFPFNDSSPNYGYKFCESVQVSVTDIGMCATFSVNAKESTNIPSKYPEKNSRIFEEGIFLALDTFGSIQVLENGPKDITLTYSNNLVHKYAMYRNGYENEFTPKEEGLFSDFRIILHPDNEIPQFLDKTHSSFQILMNKATEASLAARESYVSFTAKGSKTDRNLKASYTVNQRKCRFEDETEGLKYTKVYSESACTFECKLSIVKEYCGCLPWFLTLTKTRTKICDIFGNKCYEQKMLTLEIDYQTECGCYPGCNSYQYTPVLEDENMKESESSELLNINRVSFNKEKGETPGDWSDLSFLKSVARAKYLTRYVLDFFKGILTVTLLVS